VSARSNSISYEAYDWGTQKCRCSRQCR